MKKRIITLCILISINIFCIFVIRWYQTQLDTAARERLKLLTEQKIIASADQIGAVYEREIATISDVFPDEEQVSRLLSKLEILIGSVTTEYTIKFVTQAPLEEQSRAYLPLSIVFRAQSHRLLEVLGKLETMPYMTHVTAIFIKDPEGIEGSSEIQLGIKVYVDKSFTK